jgi:hypothetical protein
MSEAGEAAVVESAAPAEVQAAAEKMGWIPPARFKGDPERFVDAEAYIERGETVLPIVKEQNKRLHAEVAELRAAGVAQAAALKAAQDAIDQIEERHSVATQKAVEDARRQVKAQLAAASEAGDHDGVAELTDQLTQLNSAEKESGPVKKETAAAPAYVPPADLVEWNNDNPWFGKDKRKTALALGIAQELRDGGEKSVGRAFYELVKEELDQTLPPKAEPRGDKVEGARNGSENEVRQSGKKGYAHLPADAKAACDSDGRRFVGKGKKYETQAEWRARYAQIYFEES